MRYAAIITIPYAEQATVKEYLARGYEPFAMYVQATDLWIALRLPS